jgi:hypothetical protein
MEQAKPGILGQLLEEVERRVDAGEEISIGMIQNVAGQRAAGPMLLFPALIVVSPLSIIPGLPTLVGINTILVAGQIALGRKTIWLPRWLTDRCLPAKHAERLMSFLRPVSRTVDSVAKPRWRVLQGAPLRRVGAAICVLVGLMMPLLEFVPFTSTWAAAIIAVFGLVVTARDGLLAVFWIALVLGCVSVATLLLV